MKLYWMHTQIPGFNLVIERLLISGRAHTLYREPATGSFNLVIERLLISGRLFSVGLSTDACFNLVIKRLLISGQFRRGNACVTALFPSRYRAASHFRLCLHVRGRGMLSSVSISLSSGFSFQVLCRQFGHVNRLSFNLVIERLLISGQRGCMRMQTLSMFQSRYRAASHFRARRARR